MRGKHADRKKLPRRPLDHPRRCGENPTTWGLSAYCPGSPPQMRGKRARGQIQPKRARITPADAGKTYWFDSAIVTKRDHPRRCGENIATAKEMWTAIGSPPQMRGKLFICKGCNLKRRITPADAGKTTVQDTLERLTQDHPRRCGENRYKSLNSLFFKGSPPQMRGKPGIHSCSSFSSGITPADAGKTYLGS